MAADSGNGTTFSFGTFSGSVVSITPGNSTREALDVSYLGTATDREYIAGDLWDHSEWTVTFLQDVTNSTKVIPPVTTATCTVTMPEQIGSGVAPTYAGTAFVTDYSLAPLENDTVQIATFSIKFDGQTGPTFTQDA